MKLFLDTANLDEIREIRRWGVLGGLTSNPTLIAKEKPSDIETYMKELCAEVDGPVSLETTAERADEIFEQGLKLAQVAPNAVVKVAMTPDGLDAGKRLVEQGIPVNVTLTFSPAQAILAAEIGATYVSPFLGRLDDVGADRATRRSCSLLRCGIRCTWWRRPRPGRTWPRCRSRCSRSW